MRSNIVKLERGTTMDKYLKILADDQEYEKISAYEILMCFSSALDLISPLVAGHQIRVAYIALKLAQEMKLDKNDTDLLVIAACIHDIGATTVKQRNDIIDPNYESDGTHEKVGYYYTNESKMFSNVSKIIRHHHQDWDYSKGCIVDGEKIPEVTHILHLADRIDTYIDKDSYILHQVDKIVNEVVEKKDSKFKPELVDVLIRLSKNEAFWLDIVSKGIESKLFKEANLPKVMLDLDGIYDITSWFSDIIDFRSRFTSVHSKGVAISAQKIGEYMGLSKKDQKILNISGYLHDLGKLAVPNKILEKNGKLDKYEFEVVRCHTYHTYYVLSRIKGLKYITKYAAYHHERIDGNGYPFHVKGRQIPIGSRIVAVADVFTAIAEDRPYRIGMTRKQIFDIMAQKGDNKALDKEIVKVFLDNFDDINDSRKRMQDYQKERYERFWSSIK